MRLKKATKKTRKLFIFKITGILGIVLILFGIGYLYWEKRVLSFSTNPYANINNVLVSELLPKRIYIQSVSINLNIEEGRIINGVWQISDKTATHLYNSAVPGRSGNVVIYGHNLLSIFGKLASVKKGDVIDLFTFDGNKHEYIVNEILEVDPTDVSVIAPTNYQILTIYTCTGFLDSKRLVVKALPLS